jgi:shikimate dehydrogenase
VTRRPEAATPAASLAGAVGRAGAIDDVASCDVVINCTPVGMHGSAGEQDLPTPPALLQSGQVVVDLVYNPLETPWLAAARARGIEAHGGLSMLVFQAARAFGQWTGVAPPVSAMLAAAHQQLS